MLQNLSSVTELQIYKLKLLFKSVVLHQLKLTTIFYFGIYLFKFQSVSTFNNKWLLFFYFWLVFSTISEYCYSEWRDDQIIHNADVRQRFVYVLNSIQLTILVYLNLYFYYLLAFAGDFVCVKANSFKLSRTYAFCRCLISQDYPVD